MSVLHTFHSSSPVIRTERGPFSRWADLSDGLGVFGVVSFECEIVWLRDCESRIVVIDPSGGVLKDGSTYCDCSYGYLSCLASSAEDVPDFMQRYGIGASSPLVIELHLRIEDLPAKLLPKSEQHLRRSKEYWSLPRGWCYVDDTALIPWNSRYDRHGLERPAFIEKRTLFDGPIWTSKLGHEPAAAALTAALEGLPADQVASAKARFEVAAKFIDGSDDNG